MRKFERFSRQNKAENRRLAGRKSRFDNTVLAEKTSKFHVQDFRNTPWDGSFHVIIRRVELNFEHCRKVDEIKLHQNNMEYEDDVDAESGSILMFEKDSDDNMKRSNGDV